MDSINRRTIHATGAVALAGVAGRSSVAEAQAPKPIFAVAEATIPIAGEAGVFPVRRIYCIGRNYAAHAIERGSDPTREPPFFFQKPTDAIQNVPTGKVADHPYPSLTKNYHHEVELVAALKKPWEIGKSFDHAAVLGPIHPASKTGHFTKGAISLAVNGTVRQNSNLDKMIWSVAEQISKLSEAFELKAGDIIYSGTPANVGPVVKGDVLLCKLDGLPDMSIKIT
jgi:2-keto-4-pentenoate hydratase/2-oxohepta-3-ene-1,7-dioic acid hydratase in catechol pathway